MTARPRIVVAGNGMVGQRFLEKLPAADAFDITVVGEEPRPAYDRVHLSSFFAGRTAGSELAADLIVMAAGARPNIDLAAARACAVSAAYW